MEKRAIVDIESRRNRRLIIGIGAIFLMAIGVALGFSYLQSQARLGRYMATTQLPDPMMSAEMQKARLAKAHLLRDKWQSWALQHQEEVRKMLHASANDKAALMRVWESIPPTGNGDPKTIPLNGDISTGISTYTWQPILKVPVGGIQTPEERAALEKEKQQTDFQIQRHFAERRDIELAKSRNSGDTTYSLWVSGRITQEKTVLSKDKRSGKPVFTEEVTELTPPYDFLK